MSKRLWTLTAVAVVALAACSRDVNPPIDAASSDRDASLADANGQQGHGGKAVSAERKSPKPAADEVASRKTKRVDPRTGGFEIALGEWAVTPEAPALRPGPVTFVIHNRGTMAHGFEIELEGESSGSGSGDLFKAESETLEPGESTRMTVELTQSGIYKIECLVDGHDDMGMEGPLEVSADAPLLKKETDASPAKGGGEAGSTAVAITGFAFDPSTIAVEPGTEITWSNEDPAPHTVTALDGAFDSETLDGGDSFSFTFERSGTYTYRCNVHPDMKGTVEVR
jgi:plastocyanin